MVGGVGSGKTRLLAMAAVSLAGHSPGVHGMVVAPTYRMLKDVCERTFEECLLEWGIAHDHYKAESMYRLLPWGVDVMFRSTEHPHRLRGPNVGWVLGDEVQMWPDPESAPQESAISILDARIRDPRSKFKCMLLVGTPNGFDHVYQRFAEPNGKRLLPGAVLIKAPTWENTYIPGFADTLRASYDATLFRQEVGAEFVHVGSQQTYYEFSRSDHIKACKYDQGFPLVLCVDFNVGGSWVVAQDSMPRRRPIHVIDEIPFEQSGSTRIAAREFVNRYGGHGAGVEVYGDATGARRDTRQNFSDFEIIQEELGNAGRMPDVKTFVRSSNPRVMDRVNALNARLRNAKGEIGILIDPSCGALIRDMEQVRNVSGTREIDKDADSKLTHPSDALGYFVYWRYPIRSETTYRGS